jgi:hypothetical protein
MSFASAADPAHPEERAVHVRELLHPTEGSRLALAAVAIVVFVAIAIAILASAGEAGILGYLVGFLVVVLVSIWLTIQLGRARQLGRSLRVGSDTLPELQAILDDVRWNLSYDRPVEVYVTKGDGTSAGPLRACVVRARDQLRSAAIRDVVGDDGRDEEVDRRALEDPVDL